MSKIVRRKTPIVAVGSVLLGSTQPIILQTMTDTPTADSQATYLQTIQLINAGAEMVRWTINDDDAALGAVTIIRRLRQESITTPIIGDFHFNGHTLLAKHLELAELLDKYRVNPGNLGKGDQRDDHFADIIRIAIKYQKAVRIGVNWGSLDKELLAAVMDRNASLKDPKGAREIMIEAMLESALTSLRYVRDLGLPEEKIVLSAKLSVLQDMVEVYERLASSCDNVLHLGLTEAGGGIKGVTASAAALSILLQKGIGDTIRVSTTADPGAPRSGEVAVARDILQSMGFRYFMPSVTSCPGCGRTKSEYFRQLARDVQNYIQQNMPLWKKLYPGVERLKISVMGCVVNGPGESRHADIGISLPGTFEDPSAPVCVDGHQLKVLRGEHIREEFLEILEGYIKNKFG